MLKKIILFIIRIYQKLISPDHGGFLSYFKPLGVCKFRPTCSEYTYQAVKTKGLLKGLVLGALRIVRCNPLAKSKIDLVK